MKRGALFDTLRKHGLVWLTGLVIIGLSLLWIWPPRGLIGKYYSNTEWRGEPVFTARDRQISLDAVEQRQETFPQQNFSISWSGWIMIPKDGEYGFATDSDDGSSITLDGVTRVVENGGYHVARKVSGTIFLTKGMHSIQISYLQGGGAYKLRVFWQEPGKPEVLLSGRVLYPEEFFVRGASFVLRHAPFLSPCVRGFGLVLRNLPLLYPFSWGVLLLVLMGKRLFREKGNVGRVAKEYAQNIAVVLITMLVFGVIAEIVMRAGLAIRENRKDVAQLLQESKEATFEGGPRIYSLKGIVQDSPYKDIVYELKPNLKGNFREVPLVTNSKGLRDFEYSYKKPENTFRMVGLGDSSLFGWGVRLEETSLKVLETLLNQDAAGTAYEVINFAVPGYNTAIEVEVFLQKCLKYEPDLVIMHFNTNDYDVPGFMKPPQSFSTLKKSYFLNFLISRWELLTGQDEQEMLPFVFDRTVGLTESEFLDEDPNFPEEYRHLVGKRGFLRALDVLIEATRSHDIPLIVYVIKGNSKEDPSYEPDPFREGQLRLITELSQEKGFYLVNMYAGYMNYLKEHPDADRKVFWVTDEDSHPSAIAHRIEAETLYEFLHEQGLLPTP